MPQQRGCVLGPRSGNGVGLSPGYAGKLGSNGIDRALQVGHQSLDGGDDIAYGDVIADGGQAVYGASDRPHQP